MLQPSPQQSHSTYMADCAAVDSRTCGLILGVLDSTVPHTVCSV